MKKVVMGIADFQNADNLIENTEKLLGDVVGEIHLVHVIESEKIERLVIYRGDTREKCINDCTLEAKNFIEKIIKKYAKSHILITYEILTGRVSENIVRVGRKENAELIILETQRTTIDKRLQKNTIRYVVELSKIPVLLIPE